MLAIITQGREKCLKKYADILAKCGSEPRLYDRKGLLEQESRFRADNSLCYSEENKSCPCAVESSATYEENFMKHSLNLEKGLRIIEASADYTSNDLRFHASSAGADFVLFE